MASGYTSELHDGDQSFEDFALGCARAFGAYIHLRDDANGTPLSKIEDRTADYQRALDKAQTKYDDFTALTEDEQRKVYEKYVEEMIEYNMDGQAKRQAISARYGMMLGKVIAWSVPKEIEPLREFMQKQLIDSIEFDCRFPALAVLPFEEWLDDHVSHLLRSLDNAYSRLEREKKRVAEQHAFHEALMKAIKEA